MRRLVASCPGFNDAWQAHVRYWEGEPAGEYNDLGEMAEWLVEQMAAQKLDCFPALFGEVEAMLENSSPELRDLLVVGLLEDIQNASTNTNVDPDIALAFLGPQSRKGWFELIRMWHGPDASGWVGRKSDD